MVSASLGGKGPSQNAELSTFQSSIDLSKQHTSSLLSSIQPHTSPFFDSLPPTAFSWVYAQVYVHVAIYMLSQCVAYCASSVYMYVLMSPQCRERAKIVRYVVGKLIFSEFFVLTIVISNIQDYCKQIVKEYYISWFMLFIQQHCV